MPKKKTTSKTVKAKTTNSNKNTQKVIVNVNSGSSRFATNKKGTRTFTKGSSYLGNTPLRAANYPSPTIINNMPSPPMMPMNPYPTIDANRLNSIEALANNINTNIQALSGRINAPQNVEIKNYIPGLTQTDRDIMNQSSLVRDVALQTSMRGSHLTTQFSHNIPSTSPQSDDSNTTPPSFGGSSSSSGGDSSGGDGGNPYLGMPPSPSDASMQTARSYVPSSMQSVQTFTSKNLPSIKEESSGSDNSGGGSGGNDDESQGSAATPSTGKSYSDLTTALSRLSISRVPETEVQVPSSTVPTTIDVNPSQQNSVGTTEVVKPKPKARKKPSSANAATDVVPTPSTLSKVRVKKQPSSPPNPDGAGSSASVNQNTPSNPITEWNNPLANDDIPNSGRRKPTTQKKTTKKDIKK